MNPLHLIRNPIRIILTLFAALFAAYLPTAATASATGTSSPAFVVDQNSIGGKCSDSRTPAQVTVTTPWCTITHAFQAAPSGAVVDVRSGSYPYESLHGAYGAPPRLTSYVTFEPYGYGTSSPETVTIAGVSTANTSYLRFQGLHFVGSDAGGRYVPGVQVWLNSQNIQLINNDISGQGIVTQAANNVLIQGNYVHNIVRTCGMAEPDGFGVHLSGGTLPSVSHNISLIGNTIDDYAQTAVQAGNINNFLMQGNDVSTTLNPTGKVQCGDHVDLLFMEGAGQGPTTVIDNNFHDGTQSIIRNVTGLTFARNLMIRIDAWLQLEADPGAAIVNNTWSGGNTVCTGCGSLLLLDYAPGSSWTKPPFNYSAHLNGTIIENNIMQRMGIANVPASQYHEDYDILTDTNRTRSSGVQGSHTLYTPVQFTNATTGNYQLVAGSPGYLAGDPNVPAITSMFGAPTVPQPIDIGAVVTAVSGSTPAPGTTPTPTTTPTTTKPATTTTAPSPTGVTASASTPQKLAVTLTTTAPGIHPRSRFFTLMARCAQSCRVGASGTAACTHTGRLVVHVKRTRVHGAVVVTLGLPTQCRSAATSGRTVTIAVRLTVRGVHARTTSKTVRFRI